MAFRPSEIEFRQAAATATFWKSTACCTDQGNVRAGRPRISPPQGNHWQSGT